MSADTRNILPAIYTLPIQDPELKELLSDAAQFVRHRPNDFTAVGRWLDKHYSEAALRSRCEREYRREILAEFRMIRALKPLTRSPQQDDALVETFNQKRIQRAQELQERLRGPEVVTCRSYPDIHPDDNEIGAANVHIAIEWDEAMYRRQWRKIKARLLSAKMADDDFPESVLWRLLRAVDEILDVEFPDPPEHLEHSRRLVGLAALLVDAEPLPTLGEFGRWPWASEPVFTPQPHPFCAERDSWYPPVQNKPHKIPLTLGHARIPGREEALFVRVPDCPREMRYGRLSFPNLKDLLKVAIKSLDLEPRNPTPDFKNASRSRLTRREANVMARDYLQSNPTATVREVAAGIGCSTGLVSKLAGWRAVQEQRKQGRQPRKTKVVALTRKSERVIGSQDDQLQLLVAEQIDDAEPSPLAEDDPARRKAKVYLKR